MTVKFQTFKKNLKQVLKRLSPLTKSKNEESTILKVYGSVNRLPTVTFEQTFLKIFNKTESDFPERNEVQPLAIKQRNESADAFTKSSIEDNFTNYPSLVVKTMDIITDLLGLRGKLFEPVSPAEAIDQLPKSTSSGFPYYKTPKSELLSETLNQAYNCINNNDNSWLNMIVTSAWRTQMRRSGVKFRIIWVVPYLVQTFEMMFLKPVFLFFEANRTTSYCFANVFTDISPRIKNMRNFSQIFVLDFKSFDSSVPPELIINFFTWFKRFINLKNASMNKLFEDIMFYNTFAYVAVHDANGPRLVQKRGSVLSGSVFTNFMDSYCNLFVIVFTLLKMGYDPRDFSINVMGDDSLNGSKVKVDMKLFSHLVFKHFGMTITPEKCQVYGNDFETIEFLGCNMNENERLIDRDLAVKQLCLTTSWIDESVMSKEDRLFSKICSICFKFSDGWKFFDEYIQRLLAECNMNSIPSHYTQLFYTPANPSNRLQSNLVDEYKYSGWLKQ